ncbi:MAG: hypothetical protein Q4D98_08780 [Planctomycetia bacterium]|nr:hypothetical protein [Planctomycetia bacterium]
MSDASEKKPDDFRIESLLGVGFDNTDGEVRLTRGPDFALVGGSQPTHERMQETVCKVNERLEKRGKRLRDASREEFTDILREVVEKLGDKE